MIFKKIHIIMALLFCSASLAFAQEDSVQNIDEVRVSVALVQIRVRYYNQRFFEKDIRELAANDAGEILGRLAGVNLRSYGGLGGLKTISVRSLGSGHSGVVVDGFSVNNSQTGQVNLSAIQSDNLIGAIMLNGERPSLMTPLSSQVMGSTSVLQTFENTFPRSNDTLQLRANVRYGSFDHKNIYCGLKYNPKQWMISVYGKARNAVGNYPYQFLNGNTWQEGVRKNNDFLDYYYGTTIGRRTTNTVYRIGYKGQGTDQGLPGAVIFYNETADERLVTGRHTLFSDVDINIRNSRLRFYSNASNEDLIYTDPNYLGASGLVSAYYNNDLQGGLQYQTDASRRLVVRGGVEARFSSLTSNIEDFTDPTRVQYIGALSGSIDTRIGQFYGQLAGQHFDESVRTGDEAQDRTRLTSTLGYASTINYHRSTRHRFWYRNTFRMPSFNELYYNNVGNASLKPEDVYQFNYGFEIVPIKSKGELYLRTQVYYNRVNNKILAIPTKNLFVWSMQNISNVNVFAGEIMADYEWKLPRNSSLTVNGNYTYQKVIDVTPGSLNYGDQVAYTPEHITNVEIKYNYKKQGVRISNSYTSARYALNENIEANVVPGFYLMDVAIYKDLLLKRKQQLFIQVNVKNVLNQQYAYIRSFAMPGRNYLISLSYAFN